MNKAIDPEQRLDADRLRRAFDREWPTLEQQLRDIPAPREGLPESRTPEDKMDEILAIVRSLSMESAQANSAALIERILAAGGTISASRPPSRREFVVGPLNNQELGPPPS